VSDCTSHILPLTHCCQCHRPTSGLFLTLPAPALLGSWPAPLGPSHPSTSSTSTFLATSSTPISSLPSSRSLDSHRDPLSPADSYSSSINATTSKSLTWTGNAAPRQALSCPSKLRLILSQRRYEPSQISVGFHPFYETIILRILEGQGIHGYHFDRRP